MSLTFVLPLHKTYAIVINQKLTELNGVTEDYSKLLASLSDQDLDEVFNHNLFLNTTDIISVLRQNLKTHLNDTITIVSPDLFNIYLNNKKLLNQNDLTGLHKYTRDDPPKFENIVDYETLIEYNGSKQIEEDLRTPIYQLIGNINPYSVLHISVVEFINFINNREPIVIRLRNTRLLVSLQYEPYDLYDLTIETLPSAE